MTSTTCVFCEQYVKRKERVIYEDDLVVAFRDIKPKAQVHILIIPKQHIRSITEIYPPKESSHTTLLNHMRQVSESLMNLNNDNEQNNNNNEDDKWLFGFHKRPFISVDHLHLHCMKNVRRYWKWKYVKQLFYFVELSTITPSTATTTTSTTTFN
jgi:diadenosine tetraphosphate (Ap4A) HIT family hydrolase